MFSNIIGTLLLAALTLGFAAVTAPPPSSDDMLVPGVADVINGSIAPARAETLSYVSQAGEVLIFNLPATLGQRKIDSYTITKAPALSWLVQKSFFWRTLPKDAGKHEILFKAVAGGSNVEDVVVQVEIR